MITETITLEGHLIDSGILSAVMDDIVTFGGQFRILEVHIGQTQNDRSHARIEIQTQTPEQMQSLLKLTGKHGALWVDAQDAEITLADMDGAFPDDFYSTTNQKTLVRFQGRWQEVRDQEMDCGIVHDDVSQSFRCVPIGRVKRGDRIVTGQRGIRVLPHERPRTKGVFEFMASDISSEKPKSTIIRNCAAQMVEARRGGQRLLLVGGPAIVHTGAVEHVVWLIRNGFIQVLFAGNALATHDIEHALLGTSLGVYIDKATLADAGHEHHLRAINTIRRAGGIRAAVEKGVLRHGIMHACIEHNVQFVLAGSIRDDGPLPEVITDVLVAQDRMREALRGVGFVLMVATMLHSVATGNLLPAWVPCVCVDINPPVLTKLADRGSFHTIGLVTDVEPFFRSLVQEIGRLDGGPSVGL
jgi:lysine-ketoglutarate reductase/saccharopine dehydrogenase-like protein (TIGR00300 family)